MNQLLKTTPSTYLLSYRSHKLTSVAAILAA